MRPETIAIFGDPIPTALLTLAKAVDDAIKQAVESTDPIRDRDCTIKAMREKLTEESKRRMDAVYLHPRNVGSHYYPGCADTSDVYRSDCKYCECVMAPSRSSAPEGVDQFGECPGNPKLRDAYELLKAKSEPAQTTEDRGDL